MLIYVFPNRKIVVTVTSTGNTGEAYELSDDPNDDTDANMGAMELLVKRAMELLGKEKGGFLPKLFNTKSSQTDPKDPSGQGDDESRRQDKIGTDKDTQAGSDRDSNSEGTPGQKEQDRNEQDTQSEQGGIETAAEQKSAPPQPEPSSTGAWPAILPLALLAAAALLYALWRSKSQAARAKTIHGSGRTAGYPRPTGGVDSSKLKPKKRTATAEAPTRSGEVAPVTEREQRVDESPKKDTSFQTHRMRETIQACDEENLRLLLEDRLDEVDDDKADLEKQALDVALLLDEIHGLETPYAGKPDGVVLARLADDLKAELRSRDCELLDSDVWNPDIQRAVRIEPTDEPLEHPIILAKQALGVKVRGRLVRKQEVKIKKYIPS